jgi:hypothetical protein
MHRHTITLAVLTTLLAACSQSNPTAPTVRALALPRNAPASASDHTVPGTPGDPNCRGQSAAYLAQAGKNFFEGAFHGIGGLAVAAELSVKEIQGIIDDYCAGL